MRTQKIANVSKFHLVAPVRHVRELAVEYAVGDHWLRLRFDRQVIRLESRHGHPIQIREDISQEFAV